MLGKYSLLIDTKRKPQWDTTISENRLELEIQITPNVGKDAEQLECSYTAGEKWKSLSHVRLFATPWTT